MHRGQVAPAHGCHSMQALQHGQGGLHAPEPDGWGWGCLQVTARDDSGQVCAHATRQLPSGMLAADGPPTTLSASGCDRLAFLQGNLTRDATYFLNGGPVGARDIFVVRPCLAIPLPNNHNAQQGHTLHACMWTQHGRYCVVAGKHSSRGSCKPVEQRPRTDCRDIFGWDSRRVTTVCMVSSCTGGAGPGHRQRAALLQPRDRLAHALPQAARPAAWQQRARAHAGAARARRARPGRHGLLRLLHARRALLGAAMAKTPTWPI